MAASTSWFGLKVTSVAPSTLPVSEFVAAEESSWALPFEIDDVEQLQSLTLLNRSDCFRRGEQVYLGHNESSYGVFTFQHWFVTDGKYVLEFGGTNLTHGSARVHVNANGKVIDVNWPHVTMTDIIAARMREVIGLRHYSLCLRNCEHVANYVFIGRWISSQLEQSRGWIVDNFRVTLMKEHIRNINIHPIQQPLNVEAPLLYPFIDTPIVQVKDTATVSNAETFNVLVLGAVGSGKSHLINVLFNRELSESRLSESAVTNQINCFPGRILSTERDVTVVDTVGLCDTVFSELQTLTYIKGRLSRLFRRLHLVIVVLPANSFSEQIFASLRKLFAWLRFTENQDCFRFVITHAVAMDHVSEEFLRDEIIAHLNLPPPLVPATRTNIICADFPSDGDPHMITVNYERLRNAIVQGNDRAIEI